MSASQGHPWLPGRNRGATGRGSSGWRNRGCFLLRDTCLHICSVLSVGPVLLTSTCEGPFPTVPGFGTSQPVLSICPKAVWSCPLTPHPLIRGGDPHPEWEDRGRAGPGLPRRIAVCSPHMAGVLVSAPATPHAERAWGYRVSRQPSVIRGCPAHMSSSGRKSLHSERDRDAASGPGQLRAETLLPLLRHNPTQARKCCEHLGMIFPRWQVRKMGMCF